MLRDWKGTTIENLSVNCPPHQTNAKIEYVEKKDFVIPSPRRPECSGLAGFAISELVLAEDIKEGLPVHGGGGEPVHGGGGEHELVVNDGGGCDMPVPVLCPFFLLKQGFP